MKQIMSDITLTTEVIAIMAQNDIFMASNEEIIPDEKTHRFQELGKHPSKKSGWYIVINNSCVIFGSGKGDKFTVKLKHNSNSISLLDSYSATIPDNKIIQYIKDNEL